MKTWKPSKTARREFAKNMQDPSFASAYYARKEARAEKRRAGSDFDYDTAGGLYRPTKIQSDAAFHFYMTRELTTKESDACNMVMIAYNSGDSCHHDYIHLVNELIRNEKYN